PEIELVAIADVKPERRQWAKDTLPETVKVFDSAEAMLNSGIIDSCLVAVPHYDHTKYAIECFKRHIHVLVEKPAGVYTKQVKEMIEEAKKTDTTFAMMFNQRTNCIYRKMRELVQSGEYGQIKRTNWIITNWFRSQVYYDSGDWRATWSGEGGGVLLNQCPHQLDLWQWICGLPSKVQAHLHYGKWHDIEVEDDVTAYVEYPNGATGTFITTTGDAPGTNRFEVTLDKAKIVAEGDKLYIWELPMPASEFTLKAKSPFDSQKAEFREVETDGQNPQHRGVLNAFAAHILHGTPLVAGGEEGINGLTISNAMHLSSWLGKMVDIPFDDELYYEELMKKVATSRRKTNVTEIVADTSNSYSGTK
ncbi:MAG: Gfo/Idh/MocA family oxidoreductase, partial [Clostridia bacterium]|nr:Gfo/Idh/MocA family oxidoreductase [Clostridia bacterium]